MRNSFTKIKDELKDSKHNQHSYQIISVLEEKVLLQIKQLNPLLSRKQKRGLINGLGTIIKSITGNLDQSDAEKYDKAIKEISSNQFKIKDVMKEQLSILQTSIQKFNDNTKILSKNQFSLNSKIEQLEKYINSTYIKNVEANNCLFLQTIISQYTSSLQIIYDLLEKIEIAITFAKLNTLHNSILEPKDLLTEIIFINKHLNKNGFPFEPTLENIILFEKVIQIKSYTKGNQIVFLLEIPVVETESFHYYHLYSLPIRNQNSFQTIIPNSKFLIKNEHSYALFDTTCKEIIPEEFICQDVHKSTMNENAPCEIQLLKYNSNPNCELVSTEVPDVKIQKIEENQWIVVAPNGVVAIQKCTKNTDNIPLNGTYLIELNNDCEIKIKDTTIKTYQNYKPNFKNIELPKLSLPENGDKNNFMHFNPLKIENINLDELKNILPIINKQNQKLNEINNVNIPTNINIHNIVIYCCILLIIICCSLYFMFLRKHCQRKDVKGPQEEEIQMTSLSHSVAKAPTVLT